MSEPKVSDLDDLTKVAAVVIPTGSPNQQVEAALERAIESLHGKGSKKYAVARLSFGLDPATRQASVGERHKAAWKRYGEGTYSTFTTHFTPGMHGEIAAEMFKLGEARQAEKAKALELAGSPGAASLPAANEQAARRRRRLIAILGLTVLASAVIYVSVPLDATPSSSSIPPRGTVVNAATGDVQIGPFPHISPQNTQIEGGSILRACDTTTHSECTNADYISTHPVLVHRGDVIAFRFLLHDPDQTPAPYAHFVINAAFGGAFIDGEYTDITAQLTVTYGSSSALSPPKVTPIYFSLRPSDYRYTQLVYIPGSTRLLDQEREPLAYLPDGIMENGVALAKIGAPASCFACDNRYIRFVEFKARIDALSS